MVLFAMTSQGVLIDLIGQKFGKWTVLERAGTRGNGSAAWLCQCDCGKTGIVVGSRLRSGKSTCCGCKLIFQLTKHGHSKRSGDSPEYYTWASMMKRCYNPNWVNYKNYGARGIKVCDRWHDFRNFLADMGNRPAGMFIERIENEKGYGPENCKWSTRIEQTKNTRSNRMLTFNGETKPMVEWSETLKLSYHVIKNRLKYGWSIERTLTEPLIEKYKFKDLTDQKFGFWTVLERAGTKTDRSQCLSLWKCQCDCGTIKVVNREDLKRGRSKSCGCGLAKKLNPIPMTKDDLQKRWKIDPVTE